MLTQERLKELVSYDPEIGKFTWIQTRGHQALAGQVVEGTRLKNGYLSVGVDNKSYLYHRLIWLYETGRFPPQDLDHIDGNRSNNRTSNLREATRQQNLQNQKVRSNNLSGFKGVHFFKRTKLVKPWVAMITINGKCKNLGYFRTKEEAHAAYCKAAQDNFGEFFRRA